MSHFPRSPLRAVAAISGAALALLGAGNAVAAAATPMPTPSCAPASLSVAPTQGASGSSVTITGTHFGGCQAQGSAAQPSTTITVKLAFSQNQQGESVAEVTTKSNGSFSDTVGVPRSGSAGAAEFSAAGLDPATGLSYGARTSFTVRSAGGPTQPSSPAGASGSGSAGTGHVIRVPNGGVETGAGGTATGTAGVEHVGEFTLGGFALLAVGSAGVIVIRRRRSEQL